MSDGYSMLAWDTEFFGYPVAKISRNDLSLSELQEVLLKLKGKAKLIYYASDFLLEDVEGLLNKFNGALVDKKTTFSKITMPNSILNPNITEYDKGMNVKALIQLGVESGAYSRYKIDSNIGIGKYKALYKEWIINSINHVIATKVFVYVISGEILGVITLGIKNDRAEVGILAVKEEQRGRGIGKSLLDLADAFATSLGFSEVQVVTQGANKPACALYQTKGYKMERIEYFYHFWL